MRNRRNYYRILHVQPDAPREIIRVSYLTLMQRLKMHPDLGGDHWNAAVINEAFATLHDPLQRATYDRALAARALAGRPHPEFGTAGPRATRSLPQGRSPYAPGHCVFCGALHAMADAARPEAVCVVCASPLCSAAAGDADATGRSLRRVDRQFELAFYVAWPQDAPFTGTNEDVSVAGLRFTTPLELLAGEHIKIECPFCSAVAIVRHVRRQDAGRRARWVVGVEFRTLLIRSTRGTFVSALG